MGILKILACLLLTVYAVQFALIFGFVTGLVLMFSENYATEGHIVVLSCASLVILLHIFVAEHN